MKRKLLAIMVMPLVLAAAVLAGMKASSAQSSSACGTGSSGTGSSGTGGTGTGSSGTGGSGTGCDCSAPYLSVPDRLYGVSGTSASDVWAVGLQPSASLIMHWNGCHWSVAYNRPVGYFAGVSAVSPGDAWAVGGTNWFSPAQTLAEHWNGGFWIRIGTPNPPGGGVFNSVAATSPSNAWAVGYAGPGPGVPAPTQPLIEHWNGAAWTIQSFPSPAGGGLFSHVTALSASDAWVVGWTGGSGGTGQQTLVEHWNGTAWTIVPSPHPGTSSFLQGVTVISPSDAWAVGFFESASGTDTPLILHWDGSTWTPSASPNPTGDTNLQAVAAAAWNDAWAVGYTNPTRCGASGHPKCQGVIMHWDGTSWTVTPSPNPPSRYLNDYLGVTTLPGEDAWAVGSTDFAWTLIAHWNGTGWS